MPWEDSEGYFRDKCHAYIEGYRVVPEGCIWVRGDGVEFAGPMITPASEMSVLEAAQSAYEQARTEAGAEAGLLRAQVQALSSRSEFLEECIAEMAAQVYS